MEEKIEYVNPEELKPDPNQPRKYFDEGEIEQLAKTYDVQDVINPIEADENNVIILGERRWRGAIKKGLDKIPIRRKVGLSQKERYERQAIDDSMRKELTTVERFWLYTTMLANINAKANYIIDDVKSMYKDDYDSLLALIVGKGEGGIPEERGQAQLSRDIGVSQSTLSSYMSFFKVRPEIQRLFFENGVKGERSKRVTISHMYEISRLSDCPEDKAKLEQWLLQTIKQEDVKPEEKRSYPTRYDLRGYVTDFQKKLKEEAKKVAEKPPEKPAPPEAKPSKEAVEKEARKKVKKTILEKALGSLEQAEKKIEKARKLGIDVSGLVKRLEEARAKIDSDPKRAWEEGKQAKQSLDEAMREIKKSEEQRAKEERLRKKLREEEKAKLLADEEFKKKAAEEMEKEKKRKEREKAKEKIEVDIKELVVDALKAVDEAVSKLPKLEKVDVKKRGLVINLMTHKAVLGFLEKGDLSCPDCGSGGTLVWSCCGTPIKKAKNKLSVR